MGHLQLTSHKLQYKSTDNELRLQSQVKFTLDLTFENGDCAQICAEVVLPSDECATQRNMALCHSPTSFMGFCYSSVNICAYGIMCGHVWGCASTGQWQNHIIS